MRKRVVVKGYLFFCEWNYWQKRYDLIKYTGTNKNEMWLSLVERCVRDAEAAGSNPVISTKDRRVSESPLVFLYVGGHLSPEPGRRVTRAKNSPVDYFSPRINWNKEKWKQALCRAPISTIFQEGQRWFESSHLDHNSQYSLIRRKVLISRAFLCF